MLKISKFLHFGYKFRFLSVCIVGSGPSGFSVAKYLLKNHNSITVDIIEKEFAPYGLLRYGVAPDHQHIKNTINNFLPITNDNRFKYWGGISVGSQISICELSQCFDCIVLCYGRFKPNKLNISGQNLNNVYSSSEFVGWYNGHPMYKHIKPNFDGKDVIVLGNGNVAIDVSRILTINPSLLKNTDITLNALNSLTINSNRNVKLIGRRGINEVSFTTSEIRALSKLNIDLLFNNTNIDNNINTINEKSKRVVELLKKVCKSTRNYSSSIEFCFNLSAVSIEKLNNSRLCVYLKNNLNMKIEKMECDLIVYCIGFKGESIDADIPFDYEKGIINNVAGRVHHENCNISSLYCAGWIKTGSKGIIADTINSANETAQNIILDFKNEKIICKENKELKDILSLKGLKAIDFETWKKIDNREIENGQRLGKIREKFIDIN